MDEKYIFYKEFSTGEDNSVTFARVWDGGAFIGLIHSNNLVDLERLHKGLERRLLETETDERLQVLKDLVEFSLKHDPKFDIGLLMFIDKSMYSASFGNIYLSLEREGVIHNLNEMFKDKEPPHLFSGFVNEEDTVGLSLAPADGVESLSMMSEGVGIVASLGIDPSNAEFTSDDFISPSEDVTLDETDMPKGLKETTDFIDDFDSHFDDEEFDSDEDRVGKDVKEKQTEEAEFTEKKGGVSPRIGLKGVASGVGIVPRLTGGILKASSWILETLLGIGKKSKRYKMDSDKSLTRRRIVLVLLLVVLGGGLYWSLTTMRANKELRENEEQYTALYTQVDQKLDEALDKATYNPDSAISIIEGLDADLMTLNETSYEGKDVTALNNKKEDTLDIVLKRVRLKEPKVLTDARIWFDNANPTDLELWKGSIFLTDPDTSKVYRVNMENGELEEFLGRGEGLSEPRLLSVVGEDLMIFDSKEGVFIYSSGDEGELSKVSGLSASSLGQVKEIGTFESAMYFLVPKKNQVLVSRPAGAGYSLPSLRLEDEEFGTSNDLEINGMIYVNTPTDIDRFFVDTKEEGIEFTEIDNDWNISRFEVLSSLEVFVLDTKNKRLLEFNQPEASSNKFKFQKQYVVNASDGRYFNDLKELIVDPATEIVYILDGFRIIEVETK